MSALHRRNCSVQAGNKVKLSSQSNYISSQLCSPGSSHHAAIQKRTSPNPSSQLGGAGGQPHPVSLIQSSVIACHNEPQNPGPGARLVTSTSLFFLKQLGFPNSYSELNLTWFFVYSEMLYLYIHPSRRSELDTYLAIISDLTVTYGGTFFYEYHK